MFQRDAWTLMEVRLPITSQGTWKINLKHIRINWLCWWRIKCKRQVKWSTIISKLWPILMRLWKSMEIILKTTIKYSMNSNLSKLKRIKLRVCKVSWRNWKVVSTLSTAEIYKFWSRSMELSRTTWKKQVRRLLKKRAQ